MTYTGTILSIDREPTIGDLLVEILTAIGYIADTAPDDASPLAPQPPTIRPRNYCCTRDAMARKVLNGSKRCAALSWRPFQLFGILRDHPTAAV